MIFVFENLLKKRRNKTSEWRRAAQEWVDHRNSLSSYNHYTIKDYAKKYPKPGAKALQITYFILGGLAWVAVIALIGWRIATIPPKKVDPNNPHDCTTVVKKGDKIGIIAGDFDGSKGTVISQKDDCSVSLTLDNSTYTFQICTKSHSEGYCDDTKENGAIINVDKSSDIVKL